MTMNYSSVINMYFDVGKEKGMGKWLALEVKMRCRQ